MNIGIVIVAYKNPQDVISCLAALTRLDYRKFQICIVENGGNEAFLELERQLSVRNYNQLRLVQANNNLGFAGGVNAGMHSLHDVDAWWILNPDTVPEYDSLSELVQTMTETNSHLVGGVQYHPDGKIQSCGGVWRPWFARAVSIGKGRDLSDPVDGAVVNQTMNYVPGASMLVSKHWLETVGAMREDYFLYCEEIEWCLRGQNAGLRLGFTDKARVMHLQGTSTGMSNDLCARSLTSVYLDERNKLLLTRDLFPRRLVVASVSSLILLTSRYLRNGAVAQFKAGLKGWWAAMKGNRSIPLAGDLQ